MKIQIIGLGVVGKAQAFLLSKLGHEVYGYDPFISEAPAFVTKVSEPINAEVSFICVNEDNVEDALVNLINRKISGLYVIKSTTPPGTVSSLMRRYGVHICHNPEFLREKYAFEDVLNPSRIVLGECCREHGDFLERLYAPLNRPIYRTDPTTSELIKLVSNTLRAISISFWNELAALCQKMGVDINMLSHAADPAKVIGEWEGGRWGTKFFLKPYGGKCLPKDVRLLSNTFRQYGLNPKILDATEEINEWCRNNDS